MTESDAARAWSEHAEIYRSLFAPLTGYIARGLFASVEHSLVPGARCLDVACGSGALALPALAWAKSNRGTIVATDFSLEMVRLTQDALRREGEDATVATAQVEVGNREQAWKAMGNNPVMGAMLRQCTASERDAIKERLFAHLRELAGDDQRPVLLDAICNVVSARRL